MRPARSARTADDVLVSSDKLVRLLFERAGLTVIKAETQKGFPANLFRVNMYALR